MQPAGRAVEIDSPMIESVPNFSEGRNPATIDAICAAVSAVPGVRLLDRTSDPDHHRSVVTFAGESDSVAAAALAAVAVAIDTIDLTRHSGVHPRIGAVDVLPFIPLRGATLAGCARLAWDVGEEIWARFRVPVYLYEAAARTAERKALENLRRAGFAGAPDIGEGRHPSAGAIVVGARPFLIAWNIWLQTTDLEIVRRLARRIRFSSGGFPGVKALGLALASRGIVQVSINTTDFEATPLHRVFQLVEKEAGVPVIGSELIGLIPEQALALSTGHDLRWLNLTHESILEHRTET
jgi:glutamate formiminotransferase